MSQPPAKRGRIRPGAVLLFLAGICGFLTVPFFLERAASSPAPEASVAGPAAVRPIQVRTPDGQTIGWLQISYPESIRQNEEQQLDVKYIGDKGKWGRVKDIAAMSVLIQAANLGLFPEPFEYRFNLARILRTGEDSHVWTVSPKQEGDYRLLVKFNVEPDSFTVLPVAVNGIDVSTNGETSLPVRVNTRYDVPQAWVDGLKAFGYVLSFILTLPLLKTFVERSWNRGRSGVAGPGV
ncbi:MAG TPA: hypothetical protein VGM72_05815 [Micropepsaceae bacterium]